MTKKLLSILIIMLLIQTTLNLYVSAGTEEDPEMIDKKYDVKLFGIFPFIPQMNYKNADWESVWFYELENQPDNLYICMKIRELDSDSEKYDFIYVVHWIYNQINYGASIHLLPQGLTSYLAGTLDNEGNDYDQYVECSGTFDEEKNIITWIVPKEKIGNPSKFTKITTIMPYTIIRFPQDSGKVKFDLFKDLAWNVQISKDYTIKY